MPIRRLCCCLFALLLVPSGLCQAGLYSPSDQSEEKLNPEYGVFRDTYLTFKNVINEGVKNVLGPKARMVEKLYPTLKVDALTEDQLLDVSASLVRMHKNLEAIDLLTKAIARFPDSFLLKANLGTAYLVASAGNDVTLLDGARRNLEDAYASWPREPPDLKSSEWKFLQKWDEKASKQFLASWKAPISEDHLSMPRYEFYRKAGLLLQRLVKGRIFEADKAQKSPGKKKELEEKLSVDNLFSGPAGKLRFVGPKDIFEPGLLKDSERDKLPNKSLKAAILFVEQLLIWMPQDDRLYWQLGELVNADSDPKLALEIFNNLANKKDITAPKDLPFDEFKAHHNILKAYQSPEEKVSVPNNQVQKPPPPDTAGAENWEDRWRFFGVGAGSGAILALFLSWQLRRFFR